MSYVKYVELLKGKRIIINDGGSGIGLEIVQRALEHGEIVLITGLNGIKLEDAARNLKSKNIKTLVWNVSDTKMLSNHFQNAIDLLGGQL